MESRMTYFGQETLETPRLIMRPFVMEDAEAMFHDWASDPQVSQFMLWDPHQNVQESQGIIAQWLEGYANGTMHNWAIVPKTLGKPIGSIGGEQEGYSIFEIGYCIGKAHWGQGIVPEAARAVVGRAFQCGANRVQAYHDPLNAKSGRVMQKIGMQYEGTARQAQYTVRRGFWDKTLYGILLEEWQQGERNEGA